MVRSFSIHTAENKIFLGVCFRTSNCVCSPRYLYNRGNRSVVVIRACARGNKYNSSHTGAARILFVAAGILITISWLHQTGVKREVESRTRRYMLRRMYNRRSFLGRPLPLGKKFRNLKPQRQPNTGRGWITNCHPLAFCEAKFAIFDANFELLAFFNVYRLWYLT
jgi:hypothetical protein